VSFPSRDEGSEAEPETFDAEVSADVRWLAEMLHEPAVLELVGGAIGALDGKVVGVAVPPGIEDDLLQGGGGEVIPSSRDFGVRGSRPESSLELSHLLGGEGVEAAPSCRGRW
jgi:hypothetical protein